MATYLTDTSELEATGKSAGLIAQAQLAAAEEIDEAFAVAGFTVPVDTSTITNADLAARLAARLAVTEQAIALHVLIASDVNIEGETSEQGKEYERAQAWLARVAGREVILPADLASSRPTLGIVGDETITDVDNVQTLMGLPIW